ncbi:unnamed protein product, partial [Effrenium voratum]
MRPAPQTQRLQGPSFETSPETPLKPRFEVVSLVLPHLKHQLLEFQAAYVFVASRSFTLDVSNGVAQAALFPVIDLANHLWPK